MTSEYQRNMPDHIGRFRLLEELGEGAMSTVYKAFDPEISRTLAIKLLRGECAADPEYRYRFLSEAKAAGNLFHPNIVTIFDVGESSEGPYIAMEYVEGPTLEEVVESDRKLPLRDVVTIGIELAEALHYSHQRGIVHRDIKPGNIISLRDSRTIRIADFGIARMNTPDKEQHTQMGAVLGTPQYMSPEQVEGTPVDGRSDLFSVGVILYQLITGERPFKADTLTSLLMKIVQEDPAPISGKMPEVLPSLQGIVDKLLRKNPEQRFQTGQELADALRGVMSEFDEREERQMEAHILPLRVKWTVAMAVVVSLSMILGIFFVHRTQVGAMTNLEVDFGATLAAFIAVESAEPLLIQDWVAIETFVRETQERQEIRYLRIIDYKDVIRGSSAPGEIGQPYHKHADMIPVASIGGGQISEFEIDGESIFEFEVPVLYQDRHIGQVQLGLSQASLQGAADLTLYTLFALMAALIVTVVVVAYVLADRLSSPINMLKRAFRQINRGNYRYRIEEGRSDELGQLFIGFNRMAEELESKRDETETIVRSEETRRDYAEVGQEIAGGLYDQGALEEPPAEEASDDEPTKIRPKPGTPRPTVPQGTPDGPEDAPGNP